MYVSRYVRHGTAGTVFLPLTDRYRSFRNVYRDKPEDIPFSGVRVLSFPDENVS